MDFRLAISALSLSFLMILIFQNFFLKKSIIDDIKNRSSHNTIATRSGGLAIFSTIFLISIFNYFIGVTIFDYSFLIPIGLLVSVGLYDDIYNVDFKLKFIFQIIAAKIFIDNGLLIDNLHGVFGIFELNRITAQALTIFIIVAIINSINFIDGIDGLALSIVTLFILMFEFFSATTSPLTNLSYIITASLLPLFYFNFKKESKVFLGDSGSLFIGGIVSIYVVFILSQDYIIKEQYDVHKLIFVISILFYPIIDIIRIVFKRILERKSPFVADKNHIHHLIFSKTKSHISTTLIIVLINLLVIFLIQTVNLLI
tara:strand:- start:425 stop:1366 length:942 start_codon:yes stop_codon:yes gene_type:complete